MLWSYSDSRLGCHGHYTAHSIARTIVSKQSEVSAFSPVCSPWVPYDPVRRSVLLAVADHVDCVVDSGAAWRRADDAASVQLEDRGSGCHCIRNGAVLQGADVIIGVVWDLNVTLGLQNAFIVVVSTTSLRSSVWIALSIHWLILFQVFEWVSHETPWASSVSVVASAVKQLLLWELDLVAWFNLVCRL